MSYNLVLTVVVQFPQDDQVLARAVEISRERHARLTIVHVIDSFNGFDLVIENLELVSNYGLSPTMQRFCLGKANSR